MKSQLRSSFDLLSSAIISGIGGSLGLFLGFSCWTCSNTVVHHLEDFVFDRGDSSSSSASTTRKLAGGLRRALASKMIAGRDGHKGRIPDAGRKGGKKRSQARGQTPGLNPILKRSSFFVEVA